MARSEPFEYNARLLQAESGLRDMRRRFRIALAGYLVLALGLALAFLIVADQAGELKETQRSTIDLVRRGQLFDCRARGDLRAELALEGSENCDEIKGAYRRLLRRLD
jgi:hypothetical protein